MQAAIQNLDRTSAQDRQAGRVTRGWARRIATGIAQEKVRRILATAGIGTDGREPFDIRVHDDRFYGRALLDGTLGVGESYMDGWWDVADMDEFFTRAHRAELYNNVTAPLLLRLVARSRRLDLQNRIHWKKAVEEHYNLGNDLFTAMLDSNMQYTCAYWSGAGTLDEAQRRKLELICDKLQLQPGMTVLELGGGFGGLARFIAAEYGCSVVSYNTSREQVEFARSFCAGLPVRFEQKDYREAGYEDGRFDRVVSIGLCEHIGYKYHRTFLELAHAKLRDKGLFLLHTIGGNYSQTATDPWIDKYVFPNGVVPSIAQLGRAMENLFVMEDWHNFAADYVNTLLCWWERFDNNWTRLGQTYGDRFYRMWRFYMMASVGAFRARKLQLWQVVLSKGDIRSYASAR